MKKFFYSKFSLGPLWCLGGAFLLSLCWLLPNNARPWTAFHSDAWAAIVFALVSLTVFIKCREAFELNFLTVVFIGVSILPLMQYCVGIFPQLGRGWLSSAYVIGFTLSFITGAQWQRLNPMWMERFFYCAVLIGGTLSVFVQIFQWFRLTESLGMLDIWILDFPFDQVRPYANLAQPNQLATLLLWALLGTVWAFYRRHIGAFGAIFLGGFLLLGMALTQSRSGMLGLGIGLFACWKWRNRFALHPLMRCAGGLLAWYIFLLVTLPHLGHFLLLETEANFVERSINESRLEIWRTVIDGAMRQPVTGFGWNQVLPAQLAVSQLHPAVAGMYIAQSHNLFLDFIVWAGFPVGLGLSGVVVAWMWVSWRRVSEPSQALYFLVIIVVGAHAMVELPLHYAYFLLPTGLVMGTLNASMHTWPLGQISRSFVLAIWLAAAMLLGLIINDYLRLESAYNDIRFEKANFVNAPKPHIPHTLVLNHLEYIVELYSITPTLGMSDAAVQRFVDTTTFLPSAYNISKLVVILALNGRPDAAIYWMKKAKTMMSPDNYAGAQKDWIRVSKQFPQFTLTLQNHQ